ncbi:putative protein [Holospora elegans E1]|uniref:Phospholipid-binding lipoprotein MlaA n=1 Tax=Holospora elegans E1 TaxID=1427503 RepID=A0A023DXT4_9PROT|nr:putative protein [Holospora elegans E1]
MNILNKGKKNDKHRTIYFRFFLIGLSGCSGTEIQESMDEKSHDSEKRKNEKKKGVREKDIIWDPFEPWNRGVFVFNQAIEHVIWEPLLSVYRTVVPSFGQKAVHNLLEHIKVPNSVISWGLQGEGQNALNQFGRFMCNTIFGLGGILDIASDVGIAEEPQDFSRLLKAYNVPTGWFMMVPFLGPTVSRDFCGKLLNTALYTGVYPLAFGWGVLGAENINQRLIFKDSIDHVMEFSADPYAVIRRAYYEGRGEFPESFEQGEDDDEDE